MPKRRRSGLANWLSETSTPVFVLDERRIVLFFNRGCELLTGWTAADIVGQKCEYITDPDHGSIRSLTSALCPPPEIGCSSIERSTSADASGRRGKTNEARAVEIVPVHLPEASGELLTRAIHFHPIPSEDGTQQHLLGFIVPLRAEAGADATKFAGEIPTPRELHAQLGSLRGDIRSRYQLDSIIAQSPAMQRVLAQISIATRVKTPVLLVGLSGVGREHVARTIHYAGPHRLHPFVPVDCATHSRQQLQGLLERLFAQHSPEEQPLPAQRPGALFLRNVMQMPLDLQRWLWSTVTTRDRAGEGEQLRVFAADLPTVLNTSASESPLLPELLEYLSPLVIPIPSLIDRMGELPLLAQYFLEQCNVGQTRQLSGFAGAVWDEFRKFDWPGNLRQLRQVVVESHQAAQGSLVDLSDLPFRFRSAFEATTLFPRPAQVSVPLQQMLDDYERMVISQVLEETSGNRSLAADRLCMTRPRLYRRLELLGLDGSPREVPPPATDPPAG